VHLLQIWIEPRITGVRPGYEDRHYPDAEKRSRLRLIASPDGREGSTTIHQDAYVYATLLARGEAVAHEIAPQRRAYVHVARGAVAVNGSKLAGGDGVRLAAESRIVLDNADGAEVLLFDLP
jgi:redox-sensitive bicupin YhaK (pirin superfamily)